MAQITVPWTSPLDDRDCDGFSDDVELYLGTSYKADVWIPSGTSRYAACSDTSTANDEVLSATETDPNGEPFSYDWPHIPNDWPVDFNDDQRVTVLDYSTFSSHFGQTGIEPGDLETRWDFNMDGKITITDVSKFSQFNGRNCTDILPPAPIPTMSRYMGTVNTSTLWNEGCVEGLNDRGGALILSFGPPLWDDSVGKYGTQLYSGAFASVDQIRDAANQFAWGYWNCADDPPAGPHLEIIVGTTNEPGFDVEYGHGQAWATMVNGVNDLINTPPSRRAQIDVSGGIDAEAAWTDGGQTGAWAVGYDSSNGWYYYDFGDAGGCPEDVTGNPSDPCGPG